MLKMYCSVRRLKLMNWHFGFIHSYTNDRISKLRKQYINLKLKYTSKLLNDQLVIEFQKITLKVYFINLHI